MCWCLIDKIWTDVDAGGMMMIPGFTGEGQATPACAKYTSGVTVNAKCPNKPFPRLDSTDDKLDFNSRCATSMFSKVGLPLIVASSACGNPTLIDSGSVIGPFMFRLYKH